MLIQYAYALLTMLPCPIWFWYPWASAGFLLAVFGWSVYNGATYYIDVFGKRFQNELEAMKKEVQKWQNSPDLGHAEGVEAGKEGVAGGASAEASVAASVDRIPLLSADAGATTGLDGGATDVAKERKVGGVQP